MDFQTDETHRQKFERIVARNPPVLEYCIYFTPRSGSSWLTDLATRSGFLGGARECFNPQFMGEMAQFLGARTMDEYIEVIRRRFCNRGTFSFEITLFQLREVFGSTDAFMERFGRYVPFWLIREDIVLQAVSLWKKEVTGIAHSVGSTPLGRADADANLAYDADGISRWLKHIVALERLTEAHFATHQIAPVRMSYEQMMAAGPQQTRAFMARSLGRRLLPPKHGDPRHERIATDLNTHFAEQFQHENPTICAEVLEGREGTLAALRGATPKLG